jgi:hypothetical protein
MTGISSPPYDLPWEFIDKTSQETRKGFAHLVNINGLNTLTPRASDSSRSAASRATCTSATWPLVGPLLL